MINSRPSDSSSPGGAQSVGSPSPIRGRALQQDDRGPLDGELLDLYVALLIVVPVACLLRSLWS